MLDAVKKYVAEKNIEDLKYIFVDALDLDPEFREYREDFEYVKKFNMFEKHIDLTALRTNPAEWDGMYWIRLKKDLQKNFSCRRMEHMIDVAKVIFADEIAKERAARGESTVTPAMPSNAAATPSPASKSAEQPPENPPSKTDVANGGYVGSLGDSRGDRRYSVTVEQTKSRIISTSGLAKPVPPPKSAAISWQIKFAVSAAAILTAILIITLK